MSDVTSLKFVAWLLVVCTAVLFTLPTADYFWKYEGGAAHWFFVTSVDSNGEPNVTEIRVTGPGAASVVGMTNLGAGGIDIPVGIAIQP